LNGVIYFNNKEERLANAKVRAQWP